MSNDTKTTAGSDDISLDDILAEVREQSQKYGLTDTDAAADKWSDAYLDLSGITSGISDYESEDDEIVYVPVKADEEPEPAETIDGNPVVEEQIEAASFDNPEVSAKYADEGIFGDYVREVRASKERAAEAADGAVPSDEQRARTNPFAASSSDEQNRQRERFMQSLEYPSDIADTTDTAANDAPVEKPGLIIEHGEFDTQEGLEKIPKIVTADEMMKSKAEEKTIVVGEKPFSSRTDSRNEEEIVDGQMRLSGYTVEDDTEKVDEAEVEGALTEKRKEKARKFKLYDFAEKYEPELPKPYEMEEPEDGIPGESDDENDDDEDDDESADSNVEYRHFTERLKIGRLLQNERKSALLTVLALSVIEIALIVISVLTGKKAEGTDMFYAVSVLLVAIASALCISTLISGVKDAFKLKPSCDTAAVLAIITSLAHGIVAFAMPDSEGIYGVYGAAAVLTLLFNQLSGLFTSKSILENFKFCAFKFIDKLYSIKNFDSQEESFEIGRNLLLGDPELRYSCKTEFPSDFLKNSRTKTSSDRICKLVVPIGLVAGILVAGAGWIKTGSAIGALSAFTAAVCIAMPAGAALAITVPFRIISKRLNASGGMIASPEAASSCGHTNAVVVDSSELYNEQQCNMFGFKDLKAMRIDDVFLYAASLMIASGGPLGSAFEKIVGSRDILPPAKSLRYEDKLGLTALIHGQKVLLGNRNLLINHSIDAPPKTTEMRYLQSGKRVLYMAVENKLAVMFVVGYSEKTELKPYLQTIENEGINVIISVSDCNITEEFINEGFDLLTGGVRIMSPAAAQLYRDIRSTTKKTASSAIMHDGRTDSFLRTVSAAAKVMNISRIAALLEIIGAAIGLLVTFVMLIIMGLHGISVWFVMIFTAVFMAISTAIGTIQANKNK